MSLSNLRQDEYNEYYSRYIERLPANSELQDALKKGLQEIGSFFENIPEEKHGYAYAPKKWTIQEVFQHLIDTERVFAYRAFRISRRDETPLAGFDQDAYIAPSQANQKTMGNLIHEYTLTRQNTMIIADSLSADDLRYIGNASGSALSARAAFWIICAHEIWHKAIIEERYL